MNMEGVVEAVKIKEESGTFGVKVKGMWLNGFLSEHTCPKKGHKVKIEYKKSGRWNNIQKLEVVEEYPDKETAKEESEPEEKPKPIEEAEKVTKEDIKKSLELAIGYLNSAKTFLNVTKDYLEKLE